MICTAEDVKLALGVGATSTDPGPFQDAWLDRMASAASDWVERYCGRPFREARRVEYYTGAGREVILLARRPVTHVYEVKLADDGHSGGGTAAAGSDPAELNFTASTALVGGEDYSLARERETRPGGAIGLLVRLNGVWPVPSWRAARDQLTGDMPLGRGNVRIDYKAGYPPGSLPPALVLAAAGVAAYWAISLPRGGFLAQREKLGRWEIELVRGGGSLPGGVGVPDALLAMLAPFRELLL